MSVGKVSSGTFSLIASVETSSSGWLTSSFVSLFSSTGVSTFFSSGSWLTNWSGIVCLSDLILWHWSKELPTQLLLFIHSYIVYSHSLQIQ